MGWTTPAVRLFSNLRAKLWKQVMKRKFLFNFWTLFLKMYHFEVATFFLAYLVLIQSTQLYKIHAFEKVCYPLCNCCYDNCLFPISVVTIVKETNFFNTIVQLINLKYSWKKNRIKQVKSNKKNVTSSTTMVRTQTRTGLKCSKNLFFVI